MREISNPNTGPIPVPLDPADVARLAKTGCKICRGAGCVVVLKPDDAQGPEAARMICPCVQKACAKRRDVVTHQKVLSWAPNGGAADFVVRPSRSAAAVKP